MLRITISYTLSYNLHEKPGYLKDIRVPPKSSASLDTYGLLGILKVKYFRGMARITPHSRYRAIVPWLSDV